jgi:uncharacterized protein involved in response to NO
MPRSLSLRDALPSTDRRPAMSLFAKGFRPFFLLAAVFAASIVPHWLLVREGLVAPGLRLDPATWHAHEMLHGFSVAVIAGFLLTAVGNWTSRETATGAALGALTGLWLAGRLAIALGAALPGALIAALDLAFLPALCVVLARPLIGTNNRRNFVILGILGGLWLTNIATHLDALGFASAGTGRQASLVALDLVLLVIVIISGRVFPMFTRNATGIETIRSLPLLDRLAAAAMALLTAADVFAPGSAFTPAVAGAAGLIVALRMVPWGTRHTTRQPLLWVLHAGHAWLALGLVLRAVPLFDSTLPASLALHALTVGAIGTLTLGMMARVALGHTGRPLVAPTAMAFAFAAMNLAALLRSLVPAALPGAYDLTVVAAGVLWSLAFATFVARYAVILTTPRVDGKPG